jgi:hypothetical protein
LHRFVNADDIDEVAAARRPPVSYDIAGLKIFNDIIPAVVYDTRAVRVVSHHFPPAVIGNDPNFTSRWIDLCYLTADLTWLQPWVRCDVATRLTQANLI